MTPTQAQIDAAHTLVLAAKCHAAWIPDAYIRDAFMRDCDKVIASFLPALTAAAGVDAQARHDAQVERYVTLGEAMRQQTIERCAQVAGNKAAELEAWSHQDNASRLAAEMLRKVEAAIRALATEGK